jgi:hypothetical protein
MKKIVELEKQQLILVKGAPATTRVPQSFQGSSLESHKSTLVIWRSCYAHGFHGADTRKLTGWAKANILLHRYLLDTSLSCRSHMPLTLTLNRIP